MANPKTLQVFLMDGSPTGRLKCTLDNWTGQVYVVPRTALNVKPRPDAFESTGVYLLLGQNPDSGDDMVYVGQAVGRANGNGLVGRIQEHVTNGRHDFWNRAILLSTLGDTFGPTEATFLEHLFHGLACAAGRFSVSNANTPSSGNVTEEKRAELLEYSEKVQLVVSALGHRLFEPIDDPADTPETEAVFSFSLSDAEARGKRSPDGFLVLSGSRISSTVKDSAPKAVRANREKFEDAVDGSWFLKQDLLFASPSAAASFVYGGSTSGPLKWIAADGRTLQAIEAEESEQGNMEIDGDDRY